jgi:hypothetical protein
MVTIKQVHQLADVAARNYKATRKNIIAETRKLLNADDKIFERVNKIDGSFMRKLNWYPSDLSLQRIADTLKQLL